MFEQVKIGQSTLQFGKLGGMSPNIAAATRRNVLLERQDDFPDEQIFNPEDVVLVNSFDSTVLSPLLRASDMMYTKIAGDIGTVRVAWQSVFIPRRSQANVQLATVRHDSKSFRLLYNTLVCFLSFFFVCVFVIKFCRWVRSIVEVA